MPAKLSAAQQLAADQARFRAVHLAIYIAQFPAAEQQLLGEFDTMMTRLADEDGHTAHHITLALTKMLFHGYILASQGKRRPRDLGVAAQDSPATCTVLRLARDARSEADLIKAITYPADDTQVPTPVALIHATALVLRVVLNGQNAMLQTVTLAEITALTVTALTA